MVPVLTGVSTSVEQQAKGAGGTPAARFPINIQADENTNALVITAPPDLIRSLETVIQQLDVRRAQVQVETIIAEVSQNLATALGVQWIADGTPGGEGPVGASNFSGAGASISSIAGAVALGGVPTSFPDGLTLGLGRFNDDNTNFAAIITALKGDGTTNILSTPTLITMDNEEAEIVVGQEVPFITGSFTSTGTSSTPTNPFQTIQRQNVGITLKIKPQINEGNAVRLDIDQSVDSVAASSAGAADLITNKRSVKTSVIVDDGHTVILGGLIEDQVSESIQKVPLLGDIPLLGLLFKTKSTKKDKRNLMVFMRPTIIRDAAVTTRLTSSKYNYIRAQQMTMREKGLLLMNKQESPVLPALDEFLVEPPPFEEVPFEDATKDKAPKNPADVDKHEETNNPDSGNSDMINRLEHIDATPPQAVFQAEEIASRPPVF
jgi:general secretion pathway protein D